MILRNIVGVSVTALFLRSRLLEVMGEGGQLANFFSSEAATNSIPRHFHTISEGGGYTADINSRTRIERNNIGRFFRVLAAPSNQRIFNQYQRVGGVRYGEANQTLALYTKVFGLDGVLDDFAIFQLSDLRFGSQTDFIQPVSSVHHHHMFAA